MGLSRGVRQPVTQPQDPQINSAIARNLTVERVFRAKLAELRILMSSIYDQAKMENRPE
jgi:hypothetical protein